jgi:GntR family transcriptional regulator
LTSLSIDPTTPVPVYEQIRSQLAVMISAGTLPPGTRLPTIRQLCGDLGVAKATVSRAYELLTRDGLLEANGRHGTVVVDRPAPRLSRRARDEQARAAATSYALAARQLGLDSDAALDAVRRALDDLD